MSALLEKAAKKLTFSAACSAKHSMSVRWDTRQTFKGRLEQILLNAQPDRPIIAATKTTLKLEKNYSLIPASLLLWALE